MNSNKSKQTQISSNNAERITSGAELSAYVDLFKSNAQKYNVDWRLSTAQVYQKSKFNLKARAFAGTEELMKILPHSGESLGYSYGSVSQA